MIGEILSFDDAAVEAQQKEWTARDLCHLSLFRPKIRDKFSEWLSTAAYDRGLVGS